MNKRAFLRPAALLLTVSLLLTAPAACGEAAGADTPPAGGTEPPENNSGNENKPTMNQKITLKIGGRSFAATLRDNDTARAFAQLLPLTVDMSELNGNEKYHYLPSSLPTAASRPGTIHAGDLMLYGSDCVVLFYETFSSSYSYTPIGALDAVDGLTAALGRGSVQVTFEAAE